MDIQAAVLHGIGQLPRYERFPAPGSAFSALSDRTAAWRNGSCRARGYGCQSDADDVTDAALLNPGMAAEPDSGRRIVFVP